MNFFSDEMRRNPFPLYRQMRAASPVFKAPPPFDMWMVFDYENVKRVLSDHEAFSSAVPAPEHWFIFLDPPRHTKLRGLISKAFTPKSIVNLEPRIQELSRELLDRALAGREEIDLAEDYAIPLPMMVIAEMIGIPVEDWPQFRRWSDLILKLSYSMRGMENDAEAARALTGFRTATVEMDSYLARMIAERRDRPRDDLLTRLIQAEVDGEHLGQKEILGFFQLLIVAGQETTTNLINNTLVSLIENPDQMAQLRAEPDLMASAVEEVLRHRSPLQWIMRTPRQDAKLDGELIPAGKLILAILGSANRDEKQFPNADLFNIRRSPNAHVAFGHGIHSCIGAALSRMEARIAITDLLARTSKIDFSSNEPWEPRKALHVHGPARLKIRFQ